MTTHVNKVKAKQKLIICFSGTACITFTLPHQKFLLPFRLSQTDKWSLIRESMHEIWPSRCYLSIKINYVLHSASLSAIFVRIRRLKNCLSHLLTLGLWRKNLLCSLYITSQIFFSQIYMYRSSCFCLYGVGGENKK
jgi:hypothetical protein